jgi:hypothetical protein
MLKITIELWPRGSANATSVVAEGFITNDGTCTSDDLGNYDFAFHAQGARLSGRVERFSRRLGALQLLSTALEVALRGQARELARP